MDVKEITIGVDEWKPVKRIKIRYRLRDIDYILIDHVTVEKLGSDHITNSNDWNRQFGECFSLSYVYDQQAGNLVGLLDSKVLHLNMLSDRILESDSIEVDLRFNGIRFEGDLSSGEYIFKIHVSSKIKGVIAKQFLNFEFVTIRFKKINKIEISSETISTPNTPTSIDIPIPMSLEPLSAQDTQALWREYDFISHFLRVTGHEVHLRLDAERRPLAFPVARLFCSGQQSSSYFSLRVKRIISKECNNIKSYVDSILLSRLELKSIERIVQISVGPFLLSATKSSDLNGYIDFRIDIKEVNRLNGSYIQIVHSKGDDNIEGALSRYYEFEGEDGLPIIYRVEALELSLIKNGTEQIGEVIRITSDESPSKETTRSIIYADATAIVLSPDTGPIVGQKMRISDSDFEIGVENQMFPEYEYYEIPSLGIKRAQRHFGSEILYKRFKIPSYKYKLIHSIKFTMGGNNTGSIELSVVPACIVAVDFGTSSTTAWVLDSHSDSKDRKKNKQNYGENYFNQENYKSNVALRMYPKNYFHGNPNTDDVMSLSDISPLPKHFASGRHAFSVQPFQYYLLAVVEDSLAIEDPFHTSGRRDRWWVIRSLKYDISERSYLKDYFRQRPGNDAYADTVKFEENNGNYEAKKMSIPEISTQALLAEVLRSLLEEKGRSAQQQRAYDLLTRGSHRDAATLVFTYPASVGHAALRRYGDAALEFLGSQSRHQNSTRNPMNLVEPIVQFVDEARAVLETLKTDSDDAYFDRSTSLLCDVWQKPPADNRFLAIIDMGGGTIDVSVWQWWGRGREQMLRTRLISYAIRLAGDCFDKAMRADIAKLLAESVRSDACWKAENIEENDEIRNQHFVREGLIRLHQAKASAQTDGDNTVLTLETSRVAESISETVTMNFAKSSVTGDVSTNQSDRATLMAETSAFLIGLEQIAAGIAEAIKGLVREQETAEFACILSGQSFLFSPLSEAVKRGWKGIDGTVRRIDEVLHWRERLVGPGTASRSGDHDLKNVVAIGAARWAANREDMHFEEVSASGVRGCFAWLQGEYCLANGVFLEIAAILDLSARAAEFKDVTEDRRPIWQRTGDLKKAKNVVKGRFVVFRPTGYGARQIQGAPNSIVDICIRPAVYLVRGESAAISTLYHYEGTAQMLAAMSGSDEGDSIDLIKEGICFGDDVSLSCPEDGTRVLISRHGTVRHLELREIGAWGG